MKAKAPSFAGLKPRTIEFSRLARASSKKRDTSCERLLRKALHRAGLRYRTHADELVGCPDIVFSQSRVVVFVDGDFWHGRDLDKRIHRLRRGHNPRYWVSKIKSNVERDRRITSKLRRAGWSVVRVWESDIQRNIEPIITRLLRAIGRRK